MCSFRFSPISRLSVEILFAIFSEFLWDDSEPSDLPIIGDVPWFEYVRMLKTLQLVCRDWYEITSPALYSVVYLRRIEQLVALVRILDERQSAKRGISHRVQRIYCKVYVPFSWEQIYTENMARLTYLCTNTRTLVHQPILDDILPDHSRFALLKSLRFEEPLLKLRELRMGEPFIATADLQLGAIFTRFSKLSTLQIALDSEQGPLIEVTLPELETLICDFVSPYPLHSARIVANCWKLPKLRHLSIIYNCSERRDMVSLEPAAIICTSQGAGLRSLYIDNRTTYRMFATNLRKIYKACPNLIHLSYSYEFTPFLQTAMDDALPDSLALMSRTIRHISLLACIVRDTEGSSLRQHVAELTERTAFPSLETIEILDGRLHGELVNIYALPSLYAMSLLDCCAYAADGGVRILNYDSHPLRIELTERELDLEDSDEDYLTDSSVSLSESSYDSDDPDFEAEVCEELSLLNTTAHI